MTERVEIATTTSDFDALGVLYAHYEQWLAVRYADVPGLIAGIGAHQGMASERQQLATKYSPPNGAALIAFDDSGEPVGCVCYRRLDDRACEMKRLYVLPAYHRRGLGRRLCVALLQAARADGYTTMKLDTGFRQEEAHALYRSLGFEFCEPYIDYPPGIGEHIQFMARPLDDLVDTL